MAKRKLQRFAENASFQHFFQPGWDELNKGFSLKGKWRSEYFHNDHPIVLELGCGKGEYTVALSEKYPEKNFIGMDKKGARMWVGAKASSSGESRNVAFFRGLGENLPLIFEKDELDEIWITFPEPQPNSPRTKKRFTSPQFLERFRTILKKEGIIHLKTDNDELYLYTLEVIREGGHEILYNTPDLYSNSEDPEIIDVLPVKTHYEKIWLEQGLRIKYLRFKLKTGTGN